MIRKMMRTTVTAAGFAALLLSGACAHNDATTTDNQVVEVRPEDASAAGVQPGPAIADSDGNVYGSSAAPGRGNPATVGTNTNVNHIADNSSSVTIRETTTDNTLVTDNTTVTNDTMTSSTTDTTVGTVDTNRDLDTARDTDTTATMTTTTKTGPDTVATTTRTETVDVPMTSSTQDSTTTTETTPSRTRLRKD
jgi:hypothetical protein